ncbi:Nucleoside-diphosphatase [Toxoplasma gondii RUB]|uniref:Nucleoside-diphosphatase n=3 Tax=Toxoplasma gondii TaxID=5811 RepID=A0A086M8N9_TOXGO|nr:Nucleoside-diphosphatase [Toxoplasma gondii RUB]KFH10811.1 Nucleoside-diphosphatase [Toxoplasma gondii VAND]KYF41592.1 Nucleoside-diphosphatase [Toxoplasma gondii ARI]
MEPRMRSSFPTQKNGRPSPGSLIRLLCSAFLSPLFVLAAVTSHQFSTAPAGETAVLYAVVLDAGSTGTGVFVYNVVHEEDKCHGGLGRVTVQVPALASGSVRPGISAFAKGQENGHSRGHAAFPDELLEEKQREAFFTPEAHDLGEQHDILLEQHLSHLKSGSRTQEEDDEEKHANTRLPSLVNSGLSELVDAEEGVEMYLQRLRVVVDKIVQTEEQKQRTFVFFRGTAGMRVLSEDQRESLLEEIRAALSTWGFQLPEGSMGATVLEGSEEGVLSWLALNQLLGNFDGDNRLIVVEPRHLLRQKTKWNSKSPAERETNEALKGEIEAGSMAADEREGGKKPQEKKRVGLIEMGSTSAQVVIHIPSGLRPSSVYTPLASKVDLVPEASGSTRRSKTFFPPIRSHSAASFPGSPVQDFVEVDLCTERHFLYAKSYFGFGRQRGVLEHIHETVQDALEERKTAIREGRAAPPTRENPFEVSISCVPSDVRVHVRPSHLLQKASTDSAVPLSLHDDGDWGGNAEWKRETLDDARQKGRNKIFHPAGVPKTDESSETLSWRMRPDRGAGLMKSIDRIAVQGASDAAACKEVRKNRE